MGYTNISTIKTPSQKTTLQSFYSPCCGSCGERVVIDKFQGTLYALQINCTLHDEYSHFCTPLYLGTHKKILSYQKNKIISEKYYKPIYDTMALLKIYPKANRGEYYDTTLNYTETIPLTSIDSSLINEYYSFPKANDCTNEHLKLIKGFVFVKEVTDKHFIFETKKKPFNKKIKDK